MHNAAVKKKSKNQCRDMLCYSQLFVLQVAMLALT